MPRGTAELTSACREECPREFKADCGTSIGAVRRCPVKYFPDRDAKARQDFLYTFLPFLYGSYPCTTVSGKQRQAIAQAGVDSVYMSVYDIGYNCIRALLK